MPMVLEWDAQQPYRQSDIQVSIPVTLWFLENVIIQNLMYDVNVQVFRSWQVILRLHFIL